MRHLEDDKILLNIFVFKVHVTTLMCYHFTALGGKKMWEYSDESDSYTSLLTFSTLCEDNVFLFCYINSHLI